MHPHEQAIQSAIRDFNSGVYSSQCKAAAAWGIPRSSLRDRLKGSTPHAIAHHRQQRLTPGQEDFLVEWILEQDARSQPPSRARVQEMATRLLKLNGNHDSLGKRWIVSFLTRHPRVSSIVGRSVEAPRAEAPSPSLVLMFLEVYNRTWIALNIRAEDLLEMDETGIARIAIANGYHRDDLSHRAETPLHSNIQGTEPSDIEDSIEELTQLAVSKLQNR